MDNGTNTTTQDQQAGTYPTNVVQWYSDGPIPPPYSRTKEGTIILGAGRDGVAVLSVRGTNGSEAVRLDKNGLTVKNSVGTNIVTVTNTGIQVYGTNGSNIVTLDSNGLTIYNGSININNSGGSTIIDSTGLVSTNTFLNDSVFNGTIFSTTSSSFVDVTNMVLTIVLPRAANVLCGLSTTGRNDGTASGQTAISRLVLNGTQIGNEINTPTVFNGGISLQTTGATQSIQNIPAGTNTLKMRTQALNGGTTEVSTKSMFYIILGS